MLSTEEIDRIRQLFGSGPDYSETDLRTATDLNQYVTASMRRYALYADTVNSQAMSLYNASTQLIATAVANIKQNNSTILDPVQACNSVINAATLRMAPDIDLILDDKVGAEASLAQQAYVVTASLYKYVAEQHELPLPADFTAFNATTSIAAVTAKIV